LAAVDPQADVLQPDVAARVDLRDPAHLDDRRAGPLLGEVLGSTLRPRTRVQKLGCLSPCQGGSRLGNALKRSASSRSRRKASLTEQPSVRDVAAAGPSGVFPVPPTALPYSGGVRRHRRYVFALGSPGRFGGPPVGRRRPRNLSGVRVG